MRILNTSYPLSTLAERLGGAVHGNSSLIISGVCTVDNPEGNKITFIRSRSKEFVGKQLASLPTTAAALIPSHATPDRLPSSGPAVIVVKDSYSAFLDLLELFFEEERPARGIHPSALIDPSATVAPGASIGPYCFVGARSSIGHDATLYPHVRIAEDVLLGRSVTIHSGVSIRERTQIRDRVTIHDNSVIGADGFGYTPDPQLGLRKVPQLGHVVIESDVEIGANTCIDRGAFGPTSIGAGTKIDNLVQIGHNVTIGSHCIICGNVAIGGSTTIGAGVVIGGKTGVADHIEISSGARVAGGSGVTSTISEPGDYIGFPALRAPEWRRIQVQLKKMVRTKK